ncbi:MAG: hypothetical protein ACYC4S_16765 [Rhodoferax sp.]
MSLNGAQLNGVELNGDPPARYVASQKSHGEINGSTLGGIELNGPPPAVSVNISVTLSGTVSVTALAALPVRVEAMVLLSGTVTVTAACAYDNRVTPWLDQRAAVPHQTALADFMECGSGWGISLPQREATAQRWQTARQAGDDVALPADASTSRPHHVDVPWQRALQAQAQAALPHQKALQPDTLRAMPYQTADRTMALSASPMQAGVFHARHYAATWQWAAAKVRDLTAPMGASGQRSGVQWASAPWQVAGQARNGLSPWPPAQPPGPPVYFRDGNLLFECPPLVGLPLHLVFGAQPCYLPPVIVGTVVVPIRRTYVTINSIDLRRVDGNIAIPTYTFSMSLDADSWTWSWSATLPADARPYVDPATNGDPAELEVTINGVAFRLVAEGTGRDRAFANTRVRVRGRGRAAILDAPYAPVLNHGNATDRTAQQLMGDVLTVNGIGIGWAIDWQLTDWLVPGHVWSRQGVYIDGILDIAQAAGGYVQPHATAATLIVLPRYPSAPWNWATIIPDYELPSAVVSVEGIDWQRKPGYDRVHVSGASQGVLGEVTRTGMAGASVAPMVTHPLITHADAARQRGLAVLSDTGKQARVSLKLPVLPETGIITPGKFVRYADGVDTRMGLVRATSIDWSRPVLRQTIAVETHEA